MLLAKAIRAFATYAVVLAVAEPTWARTFPPWSYQDLFDRADTVVIAKPDSTDDTTEAATLSVPIGSFHVVGVVTTFRVRLVLKGDKALKSLILHHYRDADPNDGRPEGPWFAKFDKTSTGSRYLLFLRHEQDGRYAPITGQIDAQMSAIHLEAFLVDLDFE